MAIHLNIPFSLSSQLSTDRVLFLSKQCRASLVLTCDLSAISSYMRTINKFLKLNTLTGKLANYKSNNSRATLSRLVSRRCSCAWQRSRHLLDHNKTTTPHHSQLVHLLASPGCFWSKRYLLSIHRRHAVSIKSIYIFSKCHQAVNVTLALHVCDEQPMI